MAKEISMNKSAIRMREWRKKNPEKAQALNDKFRKQRLGLIKEWGIKNKEKRRGIRLKSYYKNRGENLKIVKVRNQTIWNLEKAKECGICKDSNNLEFHHWRYRLPVQQQDVSTLCNYCHNVQHKGGGML